MKATKYNNLHKYDYSPNWIFRKYSSQKRKEFVCSTGIPATEANAAAAYKHGVERFNDWLGVYLPSGRQILIRDIARAVLSAKDARAKNTQRSSSNQIKNHIIPAFGHLRPEQITPLRWQQYDTEERRKGKRTRMFNTRKALIEILNRAKDENIIHTVPKLKNFDPPAKPPVYIPKQDYLRIRRKLSWNIKLLSFVMRRQGPRPTEALNYRLSMIDWVPGDEHINIPGPITKTRRPRRIPLNRGVVRVLRWMRVNMLEGDCIFPSRDDPDQPLSAYNAVWDRTVESLGFSYDIYNLRDTFITDKLVEGKSSTFIGKYVDTSAAMIEKKYAVAIQSAMKGISG